MYRNVNYKKTMKGKW